MSYHHIVPAVLKSYQILLLLLLLFFGGGLGEVLKSLGFLLGSVQRF